MQAGRSRPNTSLRAWALATAAATLCWHSALAGQAAAFSLKQVLSAPFPAGLVAAPAGGRVAWIYNDEGSRNVWVADRGSDGALHGRALTHYSGDDGMDMGDLGWAQSGQALVYTRGGSFEGGPDVNPLSLASGAPAQTVWAVGLADGTPRRIGAGHEPVISPKGDKVAFLQGGQIWVAPLAGGASAAQLVVDRGADDALTWSPDGSRLAFTSTRAGHVVIGVFDLGAQRITWMAPSLDDDSAPEWSPDGKRIAFVRIPVGEDVVDFIAHREGAPWSILVCDAATGVGRTVWTAAAGQGSLFYGTQGARQLMWAAGDRLVFPWEHTGWVHLYAVATSGGQPRELTTGGNFEVFNTALSPDRTHIIYSANSGDVDHRHVWEVSVAAGAPRRLTGGEGIEDYPVFTTGGQIVALHSDARVPVQPVALSDSGAVRALAPGAIPADFPSAKLVVPQVVQFAASDGLTIQGQLFLPPKGTNQRGPAVLFFHGGPYRQMYPAWHMMDAYSWMYGFNQYLASEGYVVLSVNYRGGIGYGLDFREPPNFGAGGASELNDIHGAANFLRARSDVDPKRIGIWGGSYGGLMTALGLSRLPDLLATGVDYAGVHDWRVLEPQLTGNAAQLAYDSSAMATIGNWRAPVLIAQNDDDRAVPFAQSIELAQGLRKHGIQFEQLVQPDEGHVMLRFASWLTFFSASDDFLGRDLHPAPR
jgi:dipeptidyl aminopeptidase/acylaminoacyl peptidase